MIGSSANGTDIFENNGFFSNSVNNASGTASITNVVEWPSSEITATMQTTIVGTNNYQFIDYKTPKVYKTNSIVDLMPHQVSSDLANRSLLIQDGMTNLDYVFGNNHIVTANQPTPLEVSISQGKIKENTGTINYTFNDYNQLNNSDGSDGVTILTHNLSTNDTLQLTKPGKYVFTESHIQYNAYSTQAKEISIYVFSNFDADYLAVGEMIGNEHNSFGISSAGEFQLVSAVLALTTATSAPLNFNLLNNLNFNNNYDFDGSTTTANTKSITSEFNGYFDGANYTTTNFNSNFGGVFEKIGSNATIANLHLKDQVINRTGLQPTGGIANLTTGTNITISNVSNANIDLHAPTNVG